MRESEVPRRGEVWVGNLNPSRGAKTGKVRPVLVMQSDVFTEAGARTVVVLPLTTQRVDRANPLHIILEQRDQLQQRSKVLCDQPRTLDRRRLSGGPVTTLTESELQDVAHKLCAVLGMY